MSKHQIGNFSWCNSGEAVFAMSHHLRNLELSLLHGTADPNHRSAINVEIEQLIKMITRRRNMSSFDLAGFLDAQKRFKWDKEYQAHVNGSILSKEDDQ